mmetsp:Transcript_48350/g.151612  ORF Transcript_48350/g.151612 Transcript_48350/m.151612 type:complete len:421 (-) Transcript_48350:160-1422(-)
MGSRVGRTGRSVVGSLCSFPSSLLLLQLKSLDKKIAKAENGAGNGPEDAAALRARADELKKEKMQVAFTYGLKDPNHPGGADGVSSPATSECPMQDGEPKVSRPKKKTSSALNKFAASSVLLGSKGGSPTGKNIWPFSKEMSGIPTPPDEPLTNISNEHDIFADGADPMSSHAVMDDHIMSHGVGWDSSHLDDAISMEGHLDDTETCRSTTAEVKVNGALMKGILEKDKNGLVKMTLVLPNMSPSHLRNRDHHGGVSVSDADLRIASALASVTNSHNDHERNQAPVHLSLKGDQLLETGALEHDPASRPKFDVDNEHDHFGHELMDSEFFSVMDHGDIRSHVPADGDHEDTVQLGRVDEDSPSSCDSVPLKDIKEARDLKLPTESLSVDGWDEETHVWLTGDGGEHVKKEARERGAAQAV